MHEPVSAVARPEGIDRVRTLWKLWRNERDDPEPFYRLLAAEAAESLDRRHGPLAGQRIVDLGCGPGIYTLALRERGAEVIPVDNSLDEASLVGSPFRACCSPTREICRSKTRASTAPSARTSSSTRPTRRR